MKWIILKWQIEHVNADNKLKGMVHSNEICHLYVNSILYDLLSSINTGEIVKDCIGLSFKIMKNGDWRCLSFQKKHHECNKKCCYIGE